MLSRLLEMAGLRFSRQSEEEDFKQYYFGRFISLMQGSLVIGALIFFVFYLWDEFIDPEMAHTAQFVRFFVVCPFILLCALLLSQGWARQRAEVFLIAPPMVAAAGVIYIFYILDDGYNYSAAAILLLFLFSFVALRVRFTYYAILVFFVIITYNIVHQIDAQNSGRLVFINNIFVVSAGLLCLVSAFVQETILRTQFSTEKQLAAAQERIKDLLFSIVPAHITERLQSGENAYGEAVGEATIIFADLVGFTELSKRLAPRHLVEVLADIFDRFDKIAEHHKVEKIKTIGDAYMAAAGLTEARDTDTTSAARFALDIRDAVAMVSEELGYPLSIRVGMHTGPVIAGVIGTRKPIYDCWGESVNIASRLESTADAGGIQISETTYWRLRKDFVIDNQSEKDLRGVGTVKTFTLVGLLNGDGSATAASQTS